LATVVVDLLVVGIRSDVFATRRRWLAVLEVVVQQRWAPLARLVAAAGKRQRDAVGAAG